MNKFAATSNAKAVPSYLAGVGKRVQESREEQLNGAKLVESQKQIQSGRMTLAQFKSQFPQAIDHGHGNFEDGTTGQIWEVHEGFIVRRADSTIRDVLKAINDHPEMSDDEYFQLINSMKSGA